MIERPAVGQTGQRIGAGHGFEHPHRVLKLLVLFPHLFQSLRKLLLQTQIVLLDLPDQQVLFHDDGDREKVVAGLDHIVGSAAADGVNGGVHFGFARDQDKGQIRTPRRQDGKGIQSRAIREVHT